MPTYALITDIGNDILYGVEVPQIVAWVKNVIDRLQLIQAQICLTLLPPADPANLSLARYLFFRTLFFPNCRLSRETVLQRAQQLHTQLQMLGTARGITLIESRRQWYGWDPIHIHRRYWRHAWQAMMSPWNNQAMRSDQTEPPLLARLAAAQVLPANTASPLAYILRSAAALRPTFGQVKERNHDFVLLAPRRSYFRCNQSSQLARRCSCSSTAARACCLKLNRAKKSFL